MRTIQDHTGKFLSIPNSPKRIISLVPSITELLFDLGLNDCVVGITKFCIHPDEWFRTKTRVGGTKNVRIETIQKLKPDLIIANKEENVREQIEQLEVDFPVYTTVVSNVTTAIQMIRDIGDITGAFNPAEKLADHITQKLKILTSKKKINTLYLIWKEPYMSAGGDTFISNMMEYAGFTNAIRQQYRYPELSAREIASVNPEVILLSSEPYPFKEKHIDELRAICPNAKIILVDGEMFSWYGSRMQYAKDYFDHLHQTII